MGRTDEPVTDPAAPARPRRWFRGALVAFAALAALIAAGVAALHTQTAMELAVRQIERASNGQLRIESPSGSLLTTIRVRHLEWTGPTAHLVASDVALDWSPHALWSRRFLIRGFGVRHLTLDFTSSDSPATLPADLALPLEVELSHADVGRLDWRVGARSGAITGLSFAYSGGAGEHRIRDLSLVLERGTFAGDATLAAAPPFALAGTATFAGDASLRDARAEARFDGTLAELVANVRAQVGEATAQAQARLSPLEGSLLRALYLDAHGIDLAAFGPALPSTRLDARIEAAPVDGRLAGNASVQNAIPGAWDTKRLPIETLRGRFTLGAAELELHDLVATVPGVGHASGRGRIPLSEGALASSWSLDVRDLDIGRLHGRLMVTRLSGRISGEASGERRVVRGDLSQQDMTLAFTANIVSDRVDVARLRAQAGGGEFVGRGAIALSGARPFELNGTFAKLDPARFGRFPSGRLSGELALNGALQPNWSAAGRVALAQGSVLSGVALSGRASGSVSPDRVRDAMLELAAGNGRVSASGSAGATGDRLSFTLDAPNLGDLVALLPDRLPRTLSGALRAKGTLEIEPGGPGGTIDVHGERLRSDSMAADRLDAHVELASGGGAAAPVPITARRMRLQLVASGAKASGRTISTARIDGEGTLADHRTTAHVAGEGLAIDARAHGTLREQRAGDGARTFAWSGALDSLENAGRWPFNLESPASVQYAGNRLTVGATSLAIADGRVKLGEFSLDDGRIATRGEFTGIALASVMRLAAWKPPFATDLVLGGNWSIAADPHLNGTISARRERGDLYASEVDSLNETALAFGITALAVDARIVNDAVDAKATLRSSRAGNADATTQIAAAPGGTPGRIDGDAPLVAALSLEVETLRTLQPWLGTVAAVDGRARFNATARGKLSDPALSFDLAADGLRVDAPQYGLHLVNGRLRAHDEGSEIMLSEFSIQGGDGRLTASGTIASLRAKGRELDASGRVRWSAENLRVLNRPDMRLVVDGSGTLAIEDRKLALHGSLKAVEGRFEYERQAGATLSGDVVIVGRESPSPMQAGSARTPLTLDLDLDLGNALTFAGEGLETGLRGRVRVSTSADGRLVGRGSIRAVNGTYFAYGQRLVIDRGRLIFDGPLDNPGLDIVALRRNQPVEAGVAVTGTVKVPVVTLVSNPPVPDSEKLAWLVLGRAPDSQSGADAAALQAATAALLSRGGKPLTTQIAQQIGLDDITFGSATGGATATTPGSNAGLANQVVVFGKRISDRLSIAYQQGLTAASNALRLDYALTRTLTIRAEAGAVSSAGIYYRRTYD
jgi:translocation and assembly module TamB